MLCLFYSIICFVKAIYSHQKDLGMVLKENLIPQFNGCCLVPCWDHLYHTYCMSLCVYTYLTLMIKIPGR